MSFLAEQWCIVFPVVVGYNILHNYYLKKKYKRLPLASILKFLFLLVDCQISKTWLTHLWLLEDTLKNRNNAS